MADFQFYYHLDIAAVLDEATIPPAHLLAMVERLPEGSMTSAMRRGGESWGEHFGLDKNYYLGAGIFDAIQANTIGTGQWRKGKAPKFVPWPLPKSEKKKTPTTVRSLFEKMQAGFPGAG